MRTMKWTARILGLLFAASSLLTPQVRDPLPVPDVPGYKTLKADLHCHTVFSDGQVWPTTRIAEAWREGLDVLAISDHAGYNPHKQDVTPDLTRPHALAQDLARRIGIILIPAVEVAEGDLHCNVLFVTKPNAFMGLKLKEALLEARSQDAFVFWNHPGWKQTAAWFPEIAALHDQKLIHGIELVNGLTFYKEAFPWIEEKSLTIISNSDIHAPSSAQYPARTRPLTLLFVRSADEAGVREALVARRTAAWMGGEIWGGEELLRGLWHGAVTFESPELRFGSGTSSLGLHLRNHSAIPFRLRVRQAPEWLRVSGGELRAEGAVGLMVGITRDAPAGLHNLELEVEIANLHIRPGQDLVVRMPLRVEVTK